MCVCVHLSRLFLVACGHVGIKDLLPALGKSMLLLYCPKIVFLALILRFFDVQCALLLPALIETRKPAFVCFGYKNQQAGVICISGAGGGHLRSDLLSGLSLKVL